MPSAALETRRQVFGYDSFGGEQCLIHGAGTPRRIEQPPESVNSHRIPRMSNIVACSAWHLPANASIPGDEESPEASNLRQCLEELGVMLAHPHA